MKKYTHKKKSTIAKAEAGPRLSPAQEDELNGLREGIRSLGRRTTEQAFELGGYLARAKSILPEKALGAWVKAVCKFTPKTGRNYIAVHENLSHDKERLEAMAVAPTVLFVLAYAEKQDIERVIEAMETGEQLTVAQVKAMVGTTTKSKPAATTEFDLGGLAGLRKAAELKMKTDMGQFDTLVRSVLQKVEAALEPLKVGRPVKKGALSEAIMYDCRHAHDLLNSIAAPMRPDVIVHQSWRPASLPEGSAWRKVQVLLHKMGIFELWPASSELANWLEQEVRAALRFVAHAEPWSNEEEDVLAAENEDGEDDAYHENLVPLKHMPKHVAMMVEKALDVVDPSRRAEIAELVFYDPGPAKASAA